ncbi:MAG TPA: discoidin domain-containing protein [Polyangiaceae bacterium]
MTDEEPEIKQAEHVSQASRGKRILDWFWQGAALAETRRALPEPSERVTQLAQRARHSADIARSILMPAEPMDDTSTRTAASELHRESVYWALCALSADSAVVAGTVYDESVWATLGEPLLARAVQAPERIALLRALLGAGSFVYFAELPQAERVLACSELQELARLLCRELDARTRALRANYLQRGIRLGLLAVLALAFVVVALRWHDARGLTPWTVSSSLTGAGCVSPAQHCTQSPSFFFHTTAEANPWVEFDLGATRSISSVRVENRKDCCSERAVPLTVEVSTNHKDWKTVARQAEDFTTWKVSFGSVDARWVRLQAHRQTYLHLAEVRIGP